MLPEPAAAADIMRSARAMNADTALAYAHAGWPVFPCLPDSKEPYGRLAPNGVKNATTDPHAIRRWWQWEPLSNIGLACGAPGPDVVDVDTKGTVDGAATMRRLQRAGLLAGACRLVGTPSGGWHVYFAGRDQTSSNLERRHGISLRSTGYYVVAPPSTVAGRAYLVHDTRDLDATVDFDRIRRFLDPPQPARPHIGEHKAGDWSGLVAHVARQQPGNRNQCLYWAACEATKEDAPETVFAALADAAVSTGVTEHAARKTVASARRRFGGRR